MPPSHPKPQPNPRRRSSSRDSAPALTHKPYASLTPHTTYVSSSKILKKWKPLPTLTQERISSLLLALQAESLATRRNANFKPSTTNSKRLDLSDAEYSTVVSDVVTKLISRLPRMPFPDHQPTKAPHKSSHASPETDFDFESTLDRISKLEADLHMNISSTKLLRKQIRREQALLQRDKLELDVLTEGVRSERSISRRQEGRLHPIARRTLISLDGAQEDDGVDRRMLDTQQERDDQDTEGNDHQYQSWQSHSKSKATTTTSTTLTDTAITNDPHLFPLTQQLRSHLSSMSTNTSALKPIASALDAADGALRNFAWKSLNSADYESVVGLN